MQRSVGSQRRTPAAAAAAAAAICWLSSMADAQSPAPAAAPELASGSAIDIQIDGRLDEPAWRQAASIDGLTAIEPVQGEPSAVRTEVRVLADSKALYIGVRCHDDPAAMTSFAVARDADLGSEDHVKIVLGPVADGRTGYVLAVNPRGARYDALVANRGESENADWNGAWDARTTTDDGGWSLEIRVPVSILVFDGDATRWQFNVERRQQRRLERSRWATPRLDQRVTQLSRAGYITDLPSFDLGLGLLLLPSGVARSIRTNDPTDPDAGEELDASLDASLRITPELTAIFTVNSDFAEADVDRRQINLTRFPLFFPERRPFFYEGADAFDFGLGLGRQIVPFQSRRIGLVEGQAVPLRFGTKVVGRVGGTSVGGLLTRTGGEAGVAPASTMGVLRLRQDVLAESNVGVFATTGDPLGRPGSYTLGADATFQTSRLFGDRNFLVGIFGLTMGRDDIDDNPGAYGIKIDYPNDDWDIVWQSWRIDEDFDPSLGFVPRTGVYRHRFGVDYGVRPQNDWLRRQVFAISGSMFTDLSHRWETYELTAVPIDATLESGDSFGAFASAEGDRPDINFNLSDGAIVPAGEYEWLRYGAFFSTASKRAVAIDVFWNGGEFYDGTLDTFELEARTVLGSLVTVNVSAEWNRGRVSTGRFSTDLYGAELALTFSPDLTWTTFAQFDTESDSLGINTRLRWDISPVSRLFVVYNSDAVDPFGSWRTQQRGGTVKAQYEFRF
ncbi:MAG: DUF5916 domain-containing protein [Planctomycetota bacterium]